MHGLTSSEVHLDTSTSDGSSLVLPAPLILLVPLRVESCISSLVISASSSWAAVITSISPRLRNSKASTSLLIFFNALLASSIYSRKMKYYSVAYLEVPRSQFETYPIFRQLLCGDWAWGWDTIEFYHVYIIPVCEAKCCHAFHPMMLRPLIQATC